MSAGAPSPWISLLLPKLLLNLFDVYWPTPTYTTHENFQKNYVAPVQMVIVILSNQADQRLLVSHLIYQLSVRWFGCSHCLPFMFNFGCHVPEMDGLSEAQSTAFNSSINHASVHGKNYWMNLEETADFYFLLDRRVWQWCAWFQVGMTWPLYGRVNIPRSLSRMLIWGFKAE